MAAHTDDSVPRSVQTNVTLERGPVRLPLPLSAAPPRAVALVAALSGRESSSAGGSTVTRGAGIRGRHFCCTGTVISPLLPALYPSLSYEEDLTVTVPVTGTCALPFPEKTRRRNGQGRDHGGGTRAWGGATVWYAPTEAAGSGLG